MVVGAVTKQFPEGLDLPSWAAEQAAALRSADGGGTDRAGMAEALDCLSRMARAEVFAAARRCVSARLLAYCGPSLLQRHWSRLAGVLAVSVALDAGSHLEGTMRSEWGRIYAAGALQAAEELRDLGGDPARIPSRSPWSFDCVFGPSAEV